MSDRRDFMGKVLGGFAGLGALGALYAAKRTWDPLPSVEAAGFTTVDLSNAKENELQVVKLRGKPVLIIKVAKNAKSDKPIHPADAPANAYDDKRLITVGGDKFMIVVGLCTHLGCIPTYFPEEYKFVCPCHGGQFNSAGEVLKAPPPKPLLIPPFKIDGKKVVLGEEGPEYKKLKAAKLIG